MTNSVKKGRKGQVSLEIVVAMIFLVVVAAAVGTILVNGANTWGAEMTRTANCFFQKMDTAAGIAQNSSLSC